MTPDQLLYGFAVSCLGLLVAAGCLLVASKQLAAAGARLAPLAVLVLFVVTTTIAFGFGDPLYVSTIAGVTQPLFYGAAIVVDRFASMFLAMGSGATLLALPYLHNAKRGRMMLALLALVGLTTIGNIIGLAFFLACLLGAAWSMREADGSPSARARLTAGAGLSILGLFVASGGALFADLQAVASYAGNLSPGVILGGSILSALGGVLLASVVLEWRKGQAVLTPPSAIVYLAGVMYIAWRAMLFVMPVLYAELGLALVAVGLIGLLFMRREAFATSVLMANLLVGLGLAAYAIAREDWALMNLAVFASVMLLMVGGIAAAHEAALARIIEGQRVGGLVRRAPWMTLAALVNVCGWSFLAALGWWMILHGVVVTVTSSHAPWHAFVLFGLIIAATLVNLRFVSAAFGRFAQVFLGTSHEDGMQEPGVERSWPLQASGVLVALAALLAPSFLAHVGADVLAPSSGSITPAIASGNGDIAPGIVVLAVILLAFAISMIRGATSTQHESNEPAAAAALESPRLLALMSAKWKTAESALNARRYVLSRAVLRGGDMFHRARARTKAFHAYAEIIAIVLTVAVLTYVAL